MKRYLNIIFLLPALLFLFCFNPDNQEYELPDTRTLPIPEWILNKSNDYEQDTLGINPQSIWRYEYKNESVFHIPEYYPDCPAKLYSYYGRILGITNGIPEYDYKLISDFPDSALNGQLIWENPVQVNLDSSEDHSIFNVILNHFRPDSGIMCVYKTSLRHQVFLSPFSQADFSFENSSFVSLKIKNLYSKQWNITPETSSCILVEDENIRTILQNGGWDALESSYPGNKGILRVSLPGINEQATQALVEVYWYYCSSSRFDYAILLNKTQMGWEIIKSSYYQVKID